jgi:hypothetical protein
MWGEEVKLLTEEMCRTLVFFLWKAVWWRKQAQRRLDANPALQSGLLACAEKQAVICERLALKFAQRWLPLLKANGVHPTWEYELCKPSGFPANKSATIISSDLPNSHGTNDNTDSADSSNGDDPDDEDFEVQEICEWDD